VLIRPRRADDLPACAAVVREVHAADRYPRYLPGDLGGFLALPGAYACWVAETGEVTEPGRAAQAGEAAQAGGAVAGHVALVPRSLPPVMELASAALGRPASQLAVVARLLVSPRARGQGAGRRLLAAATAEAAARGLHPVLDVDTELTGAIALYESAGWTRAGTVPVRFSDGREMTEHVYLAPAPHMDVPSVLQ
jgi:ribosomal protein S18 acetylase RimI-like enzyme